ncbi:mannitol dehydrogenase family protein [Salipiger bermudensis]|uniref:mannitol dehydrogenase family protein n=1 Tax=Salipiger bermudensis TaxID=344736 RepID=UPI001CD6B706|nr:mannitol dehydrogenase family protein [Salipiger bermudensis]MCA0962390.1 mannitol dehydrogenase family protein [Salipiger bermudensis]
MTRLSLNSVKAQRYDPVAHGIGVLHIGLGAFHRAHQAVCTDDALAAHGGDWRISAVSLRSVETVDALAAQDGLYTLIERGAEGDHARVIAAISETLAAARGIAPVLDRLADPAVKVVTLTVTEKAYGIDRAAMDIDPEHAAVAHDLAHPDAPQGVLGLLVLGLKQRRAEGHPPPAILCCDNLPDNGALLRAGVVGFARRCDPELADWIAAEVAFPASMVDRITPAATEETVALAARLTDLEDPAAIETEPFFQWVIEDHFPLGRPAWEAGGAIFAPDVAPFERMKLRMLNGAHSLIAYAGFLSGHVYVRDAMADAPLAALVDRHMRAAAATVGSLDGIDLDAYRVALIQRFANPAIAHQTYQIAMDGSEKIPQRIFAPALDALAAGQDLAPFAFAVAAWLRYARGQAEDGTAYALRDPREAELTAAAQGDAAQVVQAMAALPGLFPDPLKGDFLTIIEERLHVMLTDGMAAAIAAEAA